jgi:hypothetical protein
VQHIAALFLIFLAMIIFGSLVIVLIVTLIFYLRNPKEYKWWEFGIPFVVTLAMIFGAKALIDNSNVKFDEWWGETITYIVEEEPWNEWISKICTESYPCGTDAKGNTTYCTRTYDCSYQEDYAPKWWCYTDLGNSYSMTEKLYEKLVSQYGTSKKVIKTRKNYSSRSRAVGSNGTKFQGTSVGKTSDVYKTVWPKSEDTRKGVFTKHRYENRIKASDLSIFNISVVTDEEADSLGLYKYPEKTPIYTLTTILGGDNLSEETHEKFRRLNAKFGPTNKLRLWILVFDGKPSSIAKYQENYWVKGNKNELVICIGTEGEEIKWADSFSWSLSGDLTSEVKSKVLELYEWNVKTGDNRTIPIPVPLNKEYKRMLSEYTGADTSIIPDGLILPFSDKIKNGDKITEFNKSETPVLSDATMDVFYILY